MLGDRGYPEGVPRNRDAATGLQTTGGLFFGAESSVSKPFASQLGIGAMAQSPEILHLVGQAAPSELNRGKRHLAQGCQVRQRGDSVLFEEAEQVHRGNAWQWLLVSDKIVRGKCGLTSIYSMTKEDREQLSLGAIGKYQALCRGEKLALLRIPVARATWIANIETILSEALFRSIKRSTLTDLLSVLREHPGGHSSDADLLDVPFSYVNWNRARAAVQEETMGPGDGAAKEEWRKLLEEQVALRDYILDPYLHIPKMVCRTKYRSANPNIASDLEAVGWIGMVKRLESFRSDLGTLSHHLRIGVAEEMRDFLMADRQVLTPRLKPSQKPPGQPAVLRSQWKGNPLGTFYDSAPVIEDGITLIAMDAPVLGDEGSEVGSVEDMVSFDLHGGLNNPFDDYDRKSVLCSVRKILHKQSPGTFFHLQVGEIAELPLRGAAVLIPAAEAYARRVVEARSVIRAALSANATDSQVFRGEATSKPEARKV